MDFYTVETAVALAGELPTIQGIGAKATTTIPDEVLAIVEALRETGEPSTSIGSAPNDKKNKADVIATVTKLNKVSEREGYDYSFVLRTNKEEGTVAAHVQLKPVVKVTRNRTATS